jgi:hypothetical protein
MLILPLGYWGLRILGDRLDKSLITAKMYHQTTATAVKKERVKFDEKNHTYKSDSGNPIEVSPGDEQWRVYYEIDNFDQYEEPLRSRLVGAERKRISEGRPRFRFHAYNDRSWYDSVQVGDKLLVTYKAFSDGEIEIASVARLDR